MSEEVIERCEELNFTKEETDLLYDLLGWNIGTTGEVPLRIGSTDVDVP